MQRLCNNCEGIQVKARKNSNTPSKKWQLTLACLTKVWWVNNLFPSAFPPVSFPQHLLKWVNFILSFLPAVASCTIFKLPHEMECWGPEIVSLNFYFSQWNFIAGRHCIFSGNRKVYSIAHSTSFILPCIFSCFCFIWIDHKWLT